MDEKNILKKNYKTIRIGPFTNHNSTLKTCIYLLAALLPQVIMLFITKSFSNLYIIGVCILACLISEFFSFRDKKHVKISLALSFLNGILVGFFLPAEYPLFSAFFVTLFVMIFTKFASGDMKTSWISPVAVTVVLCWFIGQFNFPGFAVTKDLLSSKNPSLSLIQNGFFPTYKFDEMITTFVNDSAFSFFGVSIPQGYVSLFWDSQSVIPAFRFSFLTLLSSIALVSFELINFEIPCLFLVTYSLLVKYLSPVFTGGIPMQGDMLLALLTSGTLFCSFFILQSFGTIPLTVKGKIFYGFIGGIIAFIFSGPGTSPVGSVVTVLFLNIISPVIQYFENRAMRIRLANTLRNENV